MREWAEHVVAANSVLSGLNKTSSEYLDLNNAVLSVRAAIDLCKIANKTGPNVCSYQELEVAIRRTQSLGVEPSPLVFAMLAKRHCDDMLHAGSLPGALACAKVQASPGLSDTAANIVDNPEIQDKTSQEIVQSVVSVIFKQRLDPPNKDLDEAVTEAMDQFLPLVVHDPMLCESATKQLDDIKLLSPTIEGDQETQAQVFKDCLSWCKKDDEMILQTFAKSKVGKHLIASAAARRELALKRTVCRGH